ncbi:MAG: tetratricopeptide repeat protein [Candidatus Eisenbacteria bacterium]|nr:tetratricopeptide repeat protein [Candidatus Eisenbacteria bacterium]
MIYVARTAVLVGLLAVVIVLGGCGGDPALTSGKVYLGQEDYVSAIEQLQLAIRNDPGAWEPHLYLGMAYAETEELEMAHDEFFTALDLAQSEADEETVENEITRYWLKYDKQGEQYNEAAQFTDAIEQFEKAIIIDDRKPEAYINLGYALHMTGQHDSAVDVFEQALEYAPDNEVLIENLVNVYETKAGNLAAVGNYEEALMFFEKIEQVAPETPDLMYNIALMHYQLKNYRQAIKYYRRQLEENEDDKDVLYRIFLCHWAIAGDLKELGQEEAAKDEYRAALNPLLQLVELEDSNVTYHRALMRVYNELGQEKEALVEVRKIEQLLAGEQGE